MTRMSTSLIATPARFTRRQAYHTVKVPNDRVIWTNM